ncbi:MAG: endonuclease/exonuclease/phosphatase family protein, partial [Gaiellaceae bacterium]
CMAVRLEGGVVVANLHATKARNPRIPDAEIVRAARWSARLARDAPAILAGDFNVDTARSVTIDQLDGYTKAGPGIDHVVARGATTGPYDRWTPERRRLGKLALSDHAPVEVEVT